MAILVPTDIYIREKGASREIRIPWLPGKIEHSDGGTTFAKYDVLDYGEVQIPTGSGLRSYQWEGILPGAGRKNDTSMLRGPWNSPSTYINILEDWRKKGTPLNLIISGSPHNVDVYLAQFTSAEAGGFGDMEYKIVLIEKRDIIVKVTAPAAAPAPAKKRSETQSSATSYTIVRGDTLWGIAKRFLGAGSKWTKIYNDNKQIIEAEARKHKKKSSNNGWWIYPGCKITIRK